MKFSKTSLAGLWLIELDPREDERGFLARTFCEMEFAALGLNTTWPQCNLTLTNASRTTARYFIRFRNFIFLNSRADCTGTIQRSASTGRWRTQR